VGYDEGDMRLSFKDQCLIVSALAQAVEALKSAPRCGGKLSRVATLLEAECAELCAPEIEEEEA